MDILSEFVTLLRPVAHASSLLTIKGEWGVKFHSKNYIKFGMVLEGASWLALKGIKKPVHFKEGDVWLLINPGEIRMGSDLKIPPSNIDEIYAKANGKPIFYGDKKAKLTTVVFGGRIDFDPLIANLLMDNFPVLVHLKKDEVSSSLKEIFKMFHNEAHAQGPGCELIFKNYIHLILIESLRTVDPELLKIGSLKAITHPKLKHVIKAIHEDYKKDWSVEDLAKIYGASRSGFAAIFKSTVGVSPMEYLLNWRMAKASELLRDSDKLIAEVAFNVGYESETAFSTAFSRVVGMPPSKFRLKH
jgi:AraC-like DNA-binding protein